eukprot:scaffold285836_cov28-Tisochrysis_lutea.AAC.1
MCPCAEDPEHRHEIVNPVGAHAMIEYNGVRYGVIIPCCQNCNNIHHEYRINWECQAVTILDCGAGTFTGRILDPVNNRSFKTINLVTGDQKKRIVEIEGIGFDGTEMVAKFDDPDHFLFTLAAEAMKSHRKVWSSEKHQVKVITVNEGVLPKKEKAKMPNLEALKLV